MLEELRDIDVSSIAELVRIKEEEELLARRLAKMETNREKVSPVVFLRVREDYEARRIALDAEARPLKERARQEYAKLRLLREEAERAVEETSLQKEELQFRRDLGEFEDDLFRGRLAECEKLLSERQQELADIIQLREQFLKAFRSEDELDLSSGAEPHAEALSSDATVVHASSRGPQTTKDVSRSDAPLSSEPPEPPPPPASAALPSDATFLFASPPVPASTTATPRQGAPSPGVLSGGESTIPTRPADQAPDTVMLAMPRIVTLINNEPAEEYALKPGVTSIGRSPKNQIRLPQAEVSRHHANIVFSPLGYRIVDAGSGNGIYVNGKLTKEHPLADGDIIQIGMQRMMYRA